MSKSIFYKVLFICLVLLILSVEKTTACTCISVSTVKSAFNSADAVITGRVEKIETEERTINGNIEHITKNTTVEILKSYKKVKAKKITISSPNTNCDWNFKGDEEKTFLLYMNFDKENRTYRVIGGCGRSNLLNQASDDISWLNGLPTSLKRTRVSGKISLYDWGWAVKFIKNVQGIKVKIYNAKNSYEVKTDMNGMYEKWDIPKGKYKVKVFIPKRLIVHNVDALGLVKYKKIGENDYDFNNFTIEVKPYECVHIDYNLDTTNQ